MAPPSYVGLGKQARDIFNRGYHFGKWKLDCKTKTSSGIQFNTSGNSDQESNKVFGSLETQYTVGDYGLTLTERWNTDNVLFAGASIQDKILEGLMLGIEGTFAPQSGDKTGLIRAAYGLENVKLDADMNIDFEGPLINASAVVGYEGWLAGYQCAFDSQASSLTKNNFALGFAGTDFVLHAAINNGQEFLGSIFNHCTEKIDVAAQVSWGGEEESETTFGIGATYLLNADALIRAKVNNLPQIGLGYQQKLREGVTLFLSALIDVKGEGGHKAGVALELQA